MRWRAWPLAALLAAALPVPAAAVDPFYGGLLRDGIHAYDRKQYEEAARVLRLACFGMLEEPPLLGGCLTRLALAQGAAGDEQGFSDTFRRIVEVEERFGAYAKAELPADLRAAFEQRAAARIPASTLQGIASFRHLVPAPASGGRTPARPGKKGDLAAAAKKPAPDRKPAGGAAGPQPAAPVTAPRALTAEEIQAVESVRRLLAVDAPARDLKQALKLAREVAEAHPGAPEVQHLAAEAAYRNSRWEEAVAFFRRGGEPGEERPERLFYLAVALYEAGDRPAAAEALRRSLPNLQKTPYVDSYARRILGGEGRSAPGGDPG